MLVTVSIDIKYLFVEISITQKFTKLLKVDIGYMPRDQFNQSRYEQNIMCLITIIYLVTYLIADFLK